MIRGETKSEIVTELITSLGNWKIDIFFRSGPRGGAREHFSKIQKHLI